MKVALVLAAAMAILAGIAPAQTVLKQSALDDFGACLVKQAPAKSEHLMRTPLDSPEERAIATSLALAHEPCLHGRRGLSGRVGEVRGAVVQALFAEHPALLAQLATRAPAAPVRPAPGQGRAFLIAYAGCLEAAAPKETAGLLQTPIQSSDEHRAFLAYGDKLSACMPYGLKYQVNYTDMRNQIAAIAYRDLIGEGVHHA